MTVRELREFLETCDQDIQVVGTCKGVRYSVLNAEQIQPYSCHDEPEYPEVVQIEIGVKRINK